MRAREFPPARPFGLRAGVLYTVCYTILAAVLLWPWPAHFGTNGIPVPDFVGNVWVLEQNLHNLTTPGLTLTSTNSFWPNEKTFAYNEALIAQTLQYALVRALGGSPLFSHNVVMFVTYPLCALGAALLAFELFGTRWGAFIAGLAFAFSSYRWDQFIHMQSMSLQWLPLMLWAMVRYDRARSRSALLGVFVFALMLALSSGYWAVLCAIAGGAALLFYLADETSRRPAILLAASLALAAFAVFLIFAPYRDAQSAFGMQRGGEVIDWSARIDSYFKPSDQAIWPHLIWLRDLASPQKPLYMGTIPMVLAMVGLVVSWRERNTRFMALVGLASLLASLGPRISLWSVSLPGPYALLRELPVVGMLRTPSRLGAGALLAIAVLAAAGLASIAPARRRIAGPLLAALLIVEVWPKKLSADLSRIVPQAPSTSAWLKTAPTGPVLELPWTDLDMDAIYLYWSIPHWQPMLNGWGSYQPKGSLGLGFIGNRWPTPYTSRVFRKVGIRYVVIHTQTFSAERKARLRPESLPDGVRLAADFGDDMIWEISSEGPVEDQVPDWPEKLYARAAAWRANPRAPR